MASVKTDVAPASALTKAPKATTEAATLAAIPKETHLAVAAPTTSATTAPQILKAL